MKTFAPILSLLSLLLATGCNGNVSGGVSEETTPNEEPVIDAGTDAGDLTDSTAVEVDLPDAGDPGSDDQPIVDDSEPFDDAGAADTGEDDSLTCLNGDTPTLVGLSASELHTALETKDFLLINVAGAPSIHGTDAIITYSDTNALVAFIGPNLKTRVVLYCQSGGRSTVAGNALVALGYCSIRQLTGGKNAWTQAGYPLE
jgi:rhodanese-related sulfurtransferase